MTEWLEALAPQISSIYFLFTLVNVLVHMIFAAAVAKDAGAIQQRGGKTHLVSGMTWAFATLVGGVFVAAIYWALHHIKFITPR